MRRASTSIVISSPSRTAAIGPPRTAFGRDVAGHEAVRGAGEAAVGEQRDVSPSPSPTIAAVTASISRMPGPPAGPSLRITTTSPALISPGGDGGHRVLLALEHARRARRGAALVAGELDDAALGREVAAQDREAAGGLERVVERPDDAPGPRSPAPSSAMLADRLAGDGDARRRAGSPASSRRLQHERDAAGRVQVGGDVAAAGLEVAQQRRALADRGRSRRCRARRRSRWRRASRCRTPLVEPPLHATRRSRSRAPRG